MNKKILITVIVVAIITIGVVLGVNYYHNNVELVTDYYGITFTPPVEKSVSFFGSTEYTDPSFQVEKLREFSNDSAAVEAKRKDDERLKKYVAEELQKELKRKVTEKDELDHAAKLDAMKEMLSQQYFVISFTHHRSYESKDFLEFLKKNGVNWQKMDEFCKEHDLKAAYYSI